MVTTSAPWSVSSCRMTVSAPSGSGAPVKMRAHSPGPIGAGREAAGRQVLHHAEPDGPLRGRAPHVLAAGGVAVHRGVGPGGDVEGADDVFGEDRVERVVERHAERRLPPHLLEDAARGLGRGERRGHGSSGQRVLPGQRSPGAEATSCR